MVHASILDQELFLWLLHSIVAPACHLASPAPGSDATLRAFSSWLPPAAAVQRVRDALVSERERLLQELRAVPYLQPFPSHSNFVLCKLADGRDARGLKDSLAKEYGIMVRHYSTKELNNYIRISVGLPEQTDKVVAALKELQ